MSEHSAYDGALVGYARTSTIEQTASFDAQKKALTDAGCSKVFAEQVSGAYAERPQLEAALTYLRAGDVFIVTKLDRLARSTKNLIEIVDTIKSKNAALRILDSNIDTTGPTGELILHVLGAIGQFEREMMLERQREGIAAAKMAGKYKGRKPTDPAKIDAILKAKARGIAPATIAREVGVSRSTVYNTLKAASNNASK